MRKIVATALSLGLLTVVVPVNAAPCKDPKTGKFIKCPPAASAKATRCKAANGKFAKCGTPGAKPI